MSDFYLYLFQAEVESLYQECLDLSSRRRKALLDHKKLYEFFSDTDETVDWIKEKELVASSEDYGKNLEHVEVRL